ncbi:MAG: hypothetical protein IPK21_07165 [Haliscomenobacter sp.]|nr:hypothetical protein [Haliscomenobacter sp.]
MRPTAILLLGAFILLFAGVNQNAFAQPGAKPATAKGVSQQIKKRLLNF